MGYITDCHLAVVELHVRKNIPLDVQDPAQGNPLTIPILYPPDFLRQVDRTRPRTGGFRAAVLPQTPIERYGGVNPVPH